MNKEIMRAYDIRGEFGKTLFPDDAYFIGNAFASKILPHSSHNRNIVIARDGRLSSPELTKALTEGLLASGAKVIDIGIAPTPLLYFMRRSLNAAAGIMVTGSHNPPMHNGFKFVGLYGKPFFGDEILSLLNVPLISAQGEYIKYQDSDLCEAYLSSLQKVIGSSAKKVAWDTGNGAAGEVITELTKRLPGEHIVLNGEIDGNFPSHDPDPTIPENLEQLIEVVIKESCDLGIAFDGDGDRLCLIDNHGKIVTGDQTILILARSVLQKHPGSIIIADVKASQYIFDEVHRLGGTAIMWKTGHSWIKSKMAETGAVFAGEVSGHLFYAENGYDDGIYAAAKIIEILGQSTLTLSEMVAQLPSAIATHELRIECPDERKFKLIEEVKQRISLDENNIINDIDGIRVNNQYGWWLLRASNTQAALVARCESSSEDNLAQLVEELRSQLELSDIRL